jgi:hypothetical protein
MNALHTKCLCRNKISHAIKSYTHIMKLKKMIVNFLLVKNFYSVEEFMTTDPLSIKIALKMLFTLQLFVLYTCMLHLISMPCSFM